MMYALVVEHNNTRCVYFFSDPEKMLTKEYIGRAHIVQVPDWVPHQSNGLMNYIAKQESIGNIISL